MTVAAAIAVASGFRPGETGPDLTPDAIAFTTSSDADGVATSSTVTFSDIDEPISLLMSEMLSASSFVSRYRKNGGSWTVFAGSTVITIADGDTLQLRMENQTGSPLAGRIRLNNASDGSAFLADWDETVTALVDQTVTNFNITTASTSAGYALSNTVTISGINTTVTLRIRETLNASHLTTEYRKNGGSWTGVSTSANVSVQNGDTLQFRLSHTRPNDVPSSMVLENASTGYNELDDWEVTVPNSADVTPDAVAWAKDGSSEQVLAGPVRSVFTTSQTITGINTPITLRVSRTGEQPSTAKVYINNVEQSGNFVAVAQDFVVESGDTVKFLFHNDDVDSIYVGWTVKNQSDGGVTLHSAGFSIAAP